VKGIPSISLSIPKISFQGKSIDWRPRNVSEWLYTLKESEYVITESFHCVAFAIIFKKKFICVVNHRRGKARLESFLGMLGLSDFLIEKEHCTEEKITELISRSINYDQISKNLQEKKESSIQFLGKALNCQL
jgi:polysaccharide pyruvyl transferase WcaK-like protein